MNTSSSLHSVRLLLTTLLLAVVLWPSIAFSQQTPRASRALLEAYSVIDSLMASSDSLTNLHHHTDSLNKAVMLDNTELKERLATMENERISLEANNTEVTDENLQLNQSNRILIIFNSVVAILLVITLVFVIRRAGRKTAPRPANTPSSPSVSTSSSQNQRYSSLEDKLTQLEKLGALKEKGILSEEEFLTEKRGILGN